MMPDEIEARPMWGPACSVRRSHQMVDGRLMRIAILGSSRSSDTVGRPVADPGGLEKFCRDLGRSLATRGHSLLVESDRERTADRCVVDGVLEVEAREAKVKVFFRSRRHDSRPYSAEAAGHRDAFTFVRLDERFVGPTHLRMLQGADLVVIVGGGSHTYTAGLAAAYMGVRIFPVATFGGASGKLWEEFSQSKDSTFRFPQKDTWAALAGDPGAALDALTNEIAGLPQLMIVHGRSQDHVEVQRILSDLMILPPVVLSEHFQSGKTIPEVFEEKALQVDAAIAVFTPDDEAASLLDREGVRVPEGSIEKRARARQNVSLEYGWFWGRLGRERVLLLLKGELVRQP